MSKYGPGGDGAAEYAFGAGGFHDDDDEFLGDPVYIDKHGEVLRSTCRFRILHFKAENHQEVLSIDNLDKPSEEPLIAAHLAKYPGGPKSWHTGNQFYQHDFQIANVEEDAEWFTTRHGARKCRTVTTITFTGGHKVEFAKVTSGYHRQRRLSSRKELQTMGFDGATKIYWEHALHRDSKTATPTPDGFEACVCTQPGYNSGLPGGACENCMNEGIVPAYNTSKGTITMNTQEMITIMQLENGAKVVRAVYLNDNGQAEAPRGLNIPTAGYCFKNVIGVDLKEGDLIAVETRDTYAIVKVTDPDVMATEVGCGLHELKHVVFKIKNDEFQRVKEAENRAVRQLALSEVTSKLDTYRKQVGEGAFGQVAGILGLDPSANALASAGHGTVDGAVIDDEVDAKLNDAGTSYD